MTDLSNISSKPEYYSDAVKAPPVGPTKGPEKQPRTGDGGVRAARSGEDITTQEEDETTYNPELEEIVKALTEAQGTSNSNIINRIIRLLIEMVTVMQHVGTSQAALLNFPTKMQAMYTDLIAKAPVYTKNGGGGTIKEDDDNKRSELNGKIQNYTDKLRSYRDFWSDTAKKLQSNINTTNEAVSQQTDLLTTFFQQLRELGSLISR